MERLNTVTVNASLGILFRMVWARLASSRKPAHWRVLTCTTCEAEHTRLWAGHVMRRGRGRRLLSSEFLKPFSPLPSARVPRTCAPAAASRPSLVHSATSRVIWTAGGSISRTRGNQSGRDKDGGHTGFAPRPVSSALLATSPVNATRHATWIAGAAAAIIAHQDLARIGSRRIEPSMGRPFRASFQMPGEGAIEVRKADEWSHDALLARGRST